jgi:hypothetical protein
VNPAAAVAPQSEVEKLADRALGEEPPPVPPVVPSPNSLKVPDSLKKSFKSVVPKPIRKTLKKALTTGKGYSSQWQKTLRSRQR